MIFYDVVLTESGKERLKSILYGVRYVNGARVSFHEQVARVELQLSERARREDTIECVITGAIDADRKPISFSPKPVEFDIRSLCYDDGSSPVVQMRTDMADPNIMHVSIDGRDRGYIECLIDCYVWMSEGQRVSAFDDIGFAKIAYRISNEIAVKQNS